MFNPDEMILYLLMGDYYMDDREKELTECRRSTYRLYEEMKNEYDRLKNNLRRYVG